MDEIVLIEVLDVDGYFMIYGYEQQDSDHTKEVYIDEFA